MTTISMRQKDIRPAPARIEFKGMKFLITDRPSDATIQSYLMVSSTATACPSHRDIHIDRRKFNFLLFLSSTPSHVHCQSWIFDRLSLADKKETREKKKLSAILSGLTVSSNEIILTLSLFLISDFVVVLFIRNCRNTTCRRLFAFANRATRRMSWRVLVSKSATSLMKMELSHRQTLLTNGSKC